MSADLGLLRSACDHLYKMKMFGSQRAVLAAIAEIEARRAQIVGGDEGWKPIETAPMKRGDHPHGRTVLLIARYPDGWGWSDIYSGWWQARESRWARWPHSFEPTHWMPCPAPPDHKM